MFKGPKKHLIQKYVQAVLEGAAEIQKANSFENAKVMYDFAEAVSEDTQRLMELLADEL